MDCGIDFRFLLINPSLLFALFTILLMCGFQERLFDISMPRWVATGTALSGSSCIVYGLCMGDLDLVMCIISHLDGLKVICHVFSQSVSLSRSFCRLSWSVWLLDDTTLQFNRIAFTRRHYCIKTVLKMLMYLGW